MDLDQVIRNRRTIRSFAPYRISRDAMERILMAADLAPSAGNLQAYDIYAVVDQKKKVALSEAAGGQEFIAQASVCLVFCASPERAAFKYGNRGRNLYCIQDATIAATFAILKAVDEGLSTAWVGAFDEKSVASVIGCQKSVPIAIISVGKPAENPAPTERRALSDLVQFLD